MLDERGHVIESTTLAENFLDRDQSLVRKQGRIHARNFEDDGDLQVAVRNAIAPTPHTPPSSGTVAIRRTGAAALKLTLMPISAADRFSMLGKPSALLII